MQPNELMSVLGVCGMFGSVGYFVISSKLTNDFDKRYARLDMLDELKSDIKDIKITIRDILNRLIRNEN